MDDMADRHLSDRLFRVADLVKTEFDVPGSSLKHAHFPLRGD